MAAEGPTIASRKASQLAIEAYAPLLPEIVGGSADLAHSNLTLWKGSKSVASDDANANYVYYGVREFGMTAIANGLALHGGFIPFDATFLVFSDYARNGVRMSADPGARHPRLHPRLDRPGRRRPDPPAGGAPGLASLHPEQRRVASVRCGRVGGELEGRDHPPGRPELPGVQPPEPAAPAAQLEQIAQIERGGYVLADAAGTPDVILIATGSEVSLATEAKAQLDAAGLKTRVVSMPSTDVFLRQDAAYRESVLPNAVRKRVAVPASPVSGASSSAWTVP